MSSTYQKLELPSSLVLKVHYEIGKGKAVMQGSIIAAMAAIGAPIGIMFLYVTSLHVQTRAEELPRDLLAEPACTHVGIESSLEQLVQRYLLQRKYKPTGMNGGGGKREIPEKIRRPTASSGTIPTCENPVTRPGIEPGSPWTVYKVAGRREKKRGGNVTASALAISHVGATKIRHCPPPPCSSLHPGLHVECEQAQARYHLAITEDALSSDRQAVTRSSTNRKATFFFYPSIRQIFLELKFRKDGRVTALPRHSIDANTHFEIKCKAMLSCHTEMSPYRMIDGRRIVVSRCQMHRLQMSQRDRSTSSLVYCQITNDKTDGLLTDGLPDCENVIVHMQVLRRSYAKGDAEHTPYVASALQARYRQYADQRAVRHAPAKCCSTLSYDILTTNMSQSACFEDRLFPVPLHPSQFLSAKLYESSRFARSNPPFSGTVREPLYMLVELRVVLPPEFPIFSVITEKFLVAKALDWRVRVMGPANAARFKDFPRLIPHKQTLQADKKNVRFEADKRGSNKGDTATCIKCAIDATRKALNWRTEFLVKRGDNEAAQECKGGGKREIAEKTRLPAASSGTTPTCETPEASSLTTTIPRPPQLSSCFFINTSIKLHRFRFELCNLAGLLFKEAGDEAKGRWLGRDEAEGRSRAKVAPTCTRHKCVGARHNAPDEQGHTLAAPKYWRAVPTSCPQCPQG
ncbi:hypothetical protein PR048_032589 [Dryococelus australis]|uniref:Uncharacterized protein n=1 Tax=Dryococelus australis TaxID=614101 RepID=A0ABQ9G5S0_9NEOP|nr:hypothetical protein PR048_032589 [Dryococelus australis]